MSDEKKITTTTKEPAKPAQPAKEVTTKEPAQPAQPEKTTTVTEPTKPE